MMILPSASPATLVFTILAALAYAAPAMARPWLSRGQSLAALGLAWLLHLGAIATLLLTQPPLFGFAPALSITGWLVLSVYAVELFVYPQLRSRWELAATGAVLALLPLVFPGRVLDPGHSAWLQMHWVLGLAAYGLFAAAVVHAALLMRAEKFMRVGGDARSGLPILTLEKLTFRFVGAGFLLLSLTLLAGAWSGGLLGTAALPGLHWHWDHKTIFSVLAWLTIASLLGGRVLSGWRGRRAVHVLYVGVGFLLLAYVGSRFVLEVLLRRPV
jgi:ABC-type uncharacterized transport system permease subunit